MSFIKSPLKAVLGFFLPDRRSLSQAPHNPSTKPAAKRSASDAFEPSPEKHNFSQGKKRKIGDTRQSLDFQGSSDPDNVAKSTEAFASGRLLLDTDRALMPPPSVALLGHRRAASSHKAPRVSLDQMETTSQITRSSRAGKSDVMDEYDMEEARRKAAATQLPPNSGIWETGERELFFHLSYRGFEPLLPENWMIDFPTLPLPVFAHQESDVPLIRCHKSTHFRGIRALQELLDTGTSVRDRTLSSQDLRTEPILEKAVNRYITWALKDFGYPNKPSTTTLPVHTIATLQPGQSTHDVIRKLASEMHILAAKHREAVNVRTSVEQLAASRLTPPSSQVGPTQIHHDPSEGEQSLPVIYGIMIASSILAIFTLNSHAPFPPFLVRTLLRNKQPSLTPEKAAAINPHLPAQLQKVLADNKLTDTTSQGDEDSGIRYIANFDFSNASADVWNALVIAILAMQIRKTMGEVYYTWKMLKDSTQEQESLASRRGISLASAGFDDDGPDSTMPPIEESWISNVDGEVSMLAPSSPTSTLDDLLSSPSRPQKQTKWQRKGKSRAISQSSDGEDPDA